MNFCWHFYVIDAAMNYWIFTLSYPQQKPVPSPVGEGNKPKACLPVSENVQYLIAESIGRPGIAIYGWCCLWKRIFCVRNLARLETLRALRCWVKKLPRKDDKRCRHEFFRAAFRPVKFRRKGATLFYSEDDVHVVGLLAQAAQSCFTSMNLKKVSDYAART